MRKTRLLITSVTFFGTVIGMTGFSLAQNAAPAPEPIPAQSEAAPDASAPTIQRIEVVDVTELPPETQTQVEQLIGQTSAENMQQLQSSLESSPDAKAALHAKGVTSAQVVATTMGGDGTLTLITKKEG